tara:strand:- start:128 stop:460 length:333 start_codon:yes stop_codon:yes gene_type:complete
MEEPETQRDIDSIYSDWRASGLTQIAYCEREDMPYSRFKNKLQKQRREASNKAASSQCGQFNAVTLGEAMEVAPPQPYCKITFSGGHTVSFSDKASLIGLKSLISDLIQL